LTVVLKQDRKPPEGPSKLELLDAPGLLKYGIGVGFAAAFITKVGSRGSIAQTDLGATAMPYFAVFPGYWFLGNVTREYCAARRLLNSKSDSLARADKLARYYTHVRYEGLTTKEQEELDTKIEDMNPTAEKGVKDTEKEKKRLKDNERVYSLTGWHVGMPGQCYSPLTWVGAYGGYPLGYAASFDVEGTKETLEVKSRGSFGLAIAPIAYINLLVGVTRVSAQVPDMAFDNSWRLTFAVGGTLDIFAKLFK